MRESPTEILIYGAGAVGSTFGWRLAQNSHVRVSAVCRSNYEAVRRHGIRMQTSLWGDGHFRPRRVFRTAREVFDVPFDYVICANKITSSNQEDFLSDIHPVVRRGTTLVLVQNGVGIELPMRQAFPNNTVLSAICYVSCIQISPGIVNQVAQIRPHAFHIGSYLLGSKNPLIDRARLEELVSLDEKFKPVQDIELERWSKMIFNGAWNPTTALYGLDTQQLISGPRSAMDMVLQLSQEVFNVAIGSGVQLPEDLILRTVKAVREEPPIVPSMLQDARINKPMEIETLCGNIWRQADIVGIPAPTVKAVYAILLDMNRHFQKQEKREKKEKVLAQISG